MPETNPRWQKISTAILRKPLARTEAKSREDGQFLAVMPYAYPRIYYLNQTAAALYAAIDGRKTGHDLVASLEVTFPDVGRAVLADDVAMFILGMIKCRVVRTAGPAAAGAGE